jgi:cob(I)alamin adenosyltransferase
MNKGYVHLYTGNGKGKTTAAFGLALRASMAGLKVYIGQFVKDMKYNETKVEKFIPDIKIEQLGRGCFVFEKPTQEDLDAAKAALEKCRDIMASGDYDLVILDEITIALYFKLISVGDVVHAIKNRHPGVEIVLTGRYAPEELIEMADLVTEMKEVKHYYASEGILSRDGIDK